MSKTLLSRIETLRNCKPKSSSPFSSHLRGDIKRLVNDSIQILKSHEQWEQSLQTHFTESDIPIIDVTHFVLDRIDDVELGLKFFDWASKNSPSGSLNGTSYSSLLKLLSRFRVFPEIEFTLEEMKTKETIPTREALSNVLCAYVDVGSVDKALEVYHGVAKLHNSLPSLYACNSLLNLLVKHRRFETAHQLYDEMVDRDNGDGIHVDYYTTCIMVRGLCLEGRIEDGRKLIESRWGKGCVPNIVFYNTLIDGYCKKGEVESAYELFKELKTKGFIPTLQTFDLVTYNTLINYLCSRGEVKEAEKLLEQTIRRGLAPNEFTYTPLVHGYCKRGEYTRATDLLIEMSTRGLEIDMISYGALIHGLVVAGEVDIALTIRDRMMNQGILPDANIYNVLMNGLFKKGKLSMAKVVLSEMLDQNIAPDAFVYATLVDGFIRLGNLDEAKKLFQLIIEKGLDPGVVGYNVMIKGFSKFGMMDNAILCIDRMRSAHHVPDVFTFSTIIDGYVKQHNMNAVLKIFGLMVKQNCKPNVVTYTSLINGYCRKGETEMAEKLFSMMRSHGLEPSVVTYTILIGNFCKEAKLGKAVSYFELMLINKCTPNDAAFHYLVNGFTNTKATAVSGGPNNLRENSRSMFEDFFSRMIGDGWTRKAAAYNCILICLCQQRMVKTALQLRNKMLSLGLCSDAVSFVALMHGICLEGNSKEWRNIISCDLNEGELQIALKYSLELDKFITEGGISEASGILQAMIKGYVSPNQDLNNLKEPNMENGKELR
uniref:Pentatricopeptide repeat-containing protein n=1 Tax=Cucumis melo TaxID=3656 RepID=A0A9I9DH60_CUCME